MKKGKIQLLVLFVFTLFIFLSGCDAAEQVSDVHASVEPMVSMKAPPCDTGNWGGFSLAEDVPDPASDVDFIFFTDTGPDPFYETDCLCDVKAYQISFDELPPLEYITVENEDGIEVPGIYFDVDENGDPCLIIPDVAELPGDAMAIEIKFEDPFSPTLLDPGGLCMIEDLETRAFLPFPGPTGAQGPVIYTELPSTPRALIPTAITYPVR